MRYRANEGSWRDGTTENISRSGLLMRADEPLSPDTAIELVVDLPAVVQGEPAARVVCRARVVRVLADDGAGAKPLLAAAITSHDFGRPHGAAAGLPVKARDNDPRG